MNHNVAALDFEFNSVTARPEISWAVSTSDWKAKEDEWANEKFVKSGCDCKVIWKESSVYRTKPF